MKLERVNLIEIGVALLFIAVGILFRLVPHPANFAPIAALALFSGARLPKYLAFAVPLVAMLVSDIFLGFYEWPIALAVYGSFFFCIFLGSLLKKKPKWTFTVGYSLIGSLVFFITTNLAVWIFSHWYPKTLVGLGRCFFLALPFFKNTLLGDLFFVGLFFGLYELINSLVKTPLSLRVTKRTGAISDNEVLR
ncbi:MAG: hypothetical protein NTV62_02130 [Candidatus Gribaldobacteria bacterium]|nr:hypothetical protein [Candidatus Gribaldobacteria bacterium]